MAFSTFARAYNRLFPTACDPPLERRLLERVFLLYAIVQFELFMGNKYVFLPRHLKVNLDEFLDSHFDRWYTDFATFWSTHSSFKPCATKCTSAIIVDGHMKLKRRLYYNQQLPLVTVRPFELVFDNIIVGCPESPASRSKFCRTCRSVGDGSSGLSQSVSRSEKNNRQIRQPINSLADVSSTLLLFLDCCQDSLTQPSLSNAAIVQCRQRRFFFR